jgi:hypothetical protein
MLIIQNRAVWVPAKGGAQPGNDGVIYVQIAA